MSWSILENDNRLEGIATSPELQPFSQSKWNSYPFASAERVEWFKDLRLGLFVHFGISACGKVDISWERYDRKLPDPGVGHIPSDVYDSWVHSFGLENFDPMSWVDLAKDAGMKYIVIITKHHDGFHLWDTAFSSYKVTAYKAQKDYLKAFVDACHTLDMPVGFYYSQRDWHHPDYEPVVAEDITPLDVPPYYAYKEGKAFYVTEKHQHYINYMHNTLRELMTQYGKVDFLWWDSAWYNGMYHDAMWQTDAIEREIRTLQPGILINNRGGLPGDFDTPEEKIGTFQTHRPWETCMCLSKHWSWTDEPARPFDMLIKEIVQCATNDGNFLISIGGRPDGTLAAPEQERLLQIGQWMQQYGHTIYGTRGGPHPSTTWGGTTYKDTTLFVHILEDVQSVVLPNLSPDFLRSSCLTGETIQVTQDTFGLTIKILSAKQSPDTIVQLTYTSLL